MLNVPLRCCDQICVFKHQREVLCHLWDLGPVSESRFSENPELVNEMREIQPWISYHGNLLSEACLVGSRFSSINTEFPSVSSLSEPTQRLHFLIHSFIRSAPSFKLRWVSCHSNCLRCDFPSFQKVFLVLKCLFTDFCSVPHGHKPKSHFIQSIFLKRFIFFSGFRFYDPKS